MEQILNIGSLGTSSIMQVMQDAIRRTPGMKSQVVCSRDLDRAHHFAELVGVEECCGNYEQMLERKDLDVIYIATPNCFHADQVIRAMEHGKHVIVEKPAAVTLTQVQEMIRAAKKNHVFFFEAITTLFMPNYTGMKRLLPKLGRLHRAELSYGRYSSKFDSYLRGELPNIFNPDMKGGALNDMGIYCIHVATDLFGKPKTVKYQPDLDENGVDLSGTLLLEYPELTCKIETAKDKNLSCGCLLEGENGLLEQTGDVNEFAVCRGRINGKEFPIEEQKGENRMIYELARFREAILRNDTDFFYKTSHQSEIASWVLEEAHRK